MLKSQRITWWCLSALLLGEAILLGIAPYERAIWCAEMVWPIGLWLILFFTQKKFTFSATSYLIFFIWMALQVGGAHTSFERVPMDWLMDCFCNVHLFWLGNVQSSQAEFSYLLLV